MNCGTLKGLEAHKARKEYPCKWCIKFRDDPAPPPIKCGTINGRAKHRRNGDPVCEPCRAAWNTYQRGRTTKASRANTAATAEIRHGTPWGYRQHVARKEPACTPCRLAANQRRKEDRDKKKAATQ